MKHAFLLSTCLAGIFFYLCGLSACKQQIVYPADFAVADSLASADPDRAVEMLASWKEEMKLKPEHVRNYYQLLCIKANDKAYITHTSDSIIKCLVRYYETDGDKRRLPETYYYAGRVLRDMENAPLAIEDFEKALDVADGEEHLFLKGKIYSQMGRIFFNQKLTEQALILTRKACLCDTRLNNTEALAYNFCTIADIYWDRFQLDSAEFYYKASISLMEILKDTLQTNMMKTKLGHLYIDLHRYNEIEDLIRPYLNHHYEFDKNFIYSVAAEYFLATEQWDSVQFYYKKALNVGTIITKRNAYWGFSQIALAHNNIEESQHYLAKYQICKDSIQKMNNAQEVGRRYFKYQYEQREKENRRLTKVYARKQRHLTIAIVLAASFLIGAAAYIIYNRKKNNKKIGNPTEVPISKAPEPTEVIELTELRIYLLDKANKGELLRDNDWSIIEKAIRKNFPDFITKLHKTYPCRTVELRTCMLIKLKVPPTNIAIFIGLSKEGVSSIRRRLHKKVFGGKGSAPKWDAFIHTL